MRRTVTAHLAADVADPALLALQVAVAGPAPVEQLAITSDGARVPMRENEFGAIGGRTQLQPLVEPQPSHT